MNIAQTDTEVINAATNIPVWSVMMLIVALSLVVSGLIATTAVLLGSDRQHSRLILTISFALTTAGAGLAWLAWNI